MIAAIVFMSVAAQTCPTSPSPISLDQAMARTLTGVRSGNAKALLAQMSLAGVTFAAPIGAQGMGMPYAMLSDQFDKREGRYCDLFVCRGRAGRLNVLFNGGKTQKAIDFKHGRATVVLNGHSPRELDLGYSYNTRCQWELTSISAF